MKFTLCGSALVLNKGGYIGDSTRREIKWAAMRNKRIFWLEPPRASSGFSISQITNVFDMTAELIQIKDKAKADIDESTRSILWPKRDPGEIR